MKIAVANFKAELNSVQISEWLQNFKSLFSQHTPEESRKIILCPPAVFLPQFKEELADLPVSLGSQDLSQFEAGGYTGEITAAMLNGMVNYVLIGHSERRIYFHENSETIRRKIGLANHYRLKVILCAENPEVYQGQIWALAYEPNSAIGTGKAADPKESWQTLQQLKRVISAEHHLYGGSVNENNAAQFAQAGFDGVLIGKKSLDPSLFLDIVSSL